MQRKGFHRNMKNPWKKLVPEHDGSKKSVTGLKIVVALSQFRVYFDVSANNFWETAGFVSAAAFLRPSVTFHLLDCTHIHDYFLEIFTRCPANFGSLFTFLGSRILPGPLPTRFHALHRVLGPNCSRNWRKKNPFVGSPGPVVDSKHLPTQNCFFVVNWDSAGS